MTGPFNVFDNVDQPLEHGSLALVLTATEWAGRILGRSETARYPNRAAWSANGNNLVLRGDIASRSYRIRMVAEDAQPWRSTPRARCIPAPAPGGVGRDATMRSARGRPDARPQLVREGARTRPRLSSASSRTGAASSGGILECAGIGDSWVTWTNCIVTSMLGRRSGRDSSQRGSMRTAPPVSAEAEQERPDREHVPAAD